MALILLASATGAPGATTTALGFALTWPRDVLLVDCDRDPAQAVQAGYLRGVDASGHGMLTLARAHRESRPLAAEIWLQAVSLSRAEDTERRFMPGFSHPGQPALFGPVWPDLAKACAQVSDGGVDVIVDAGRLGAQGLPPPLVMVADVLLVVVQSSLRSLAALRLHLPSQIEHIDAMPGRAQLGLVVVGENRPYSAREIAAQFGVEVWCCIAHDGPGAAVLSDGEPEPKRFADRPLMRTLSGGASRVCDRINSANLERMGRLVNS